MQVPETVVRHIPRHPTRKASVLEQAREGSGVDSDAAAPSPRVRVGSRDDDSRSPRPVAGSLELLSPPGQRRRGEEVVPRRAPDAYPRPRAGASGGRRRGRSRLGGSGCRRRGACAHANDDCAASGRRWANASSRPGRGGGGGQGRPHRPERMRPGKTQPEIGQRVGSLKHSRATRRRENHGRGCRCLGGAHLTQPKRLAMRSSSTRSLVNDASRGEGIRTACSEGSQRRRQLCRR